MLKSQAEGAIKGGVQQKGRDNWLKIHHFSHLVDSPRDQQSGRATGHRHHHPVEVWCEYDQATPQLYKSLAQNHLLTDVEFKFFSATKLGAKTAFGGGTEYLTYTVKLENAFVSSMRTVLPYNLDRELMNIESYNIIKFTYQKILWMWEGGVSTEDDWESPVV